MLVNLNKIRTVGKKVGGGASVENSMKDEEFEGKFKHSKVDLF